MKTAIRLIVLAILSTPFVACSPQYGCYTENTSKQEMMSPNVIATDLVPETVVFGSQVTNCTD